MRRLPLPQAGVNDVYAAAVDSCSDVNLSARLLAARTVILDEETRYNSLAQSGRLDLVPQSQTVNADLTAAEMQSLYKQGMSNARGAARPFYDVLMSAAPHGTCPICGQGKVRTLDHHLPQSKYPALVVTPINLIPSCRDCNFLKHTKWPAKIEEQTIHPYFDDFTGARWLHANVSESSPPAVLYEVRLPEGWEEVVGERLRRHMVVFKLGATFTLHASEELSQISAELQDLYGKGGPAAVRQELEVRAESREATHRNSWQTAMYYALASSEWFWTEGLFLLRPTAVVTAA